jgi:hypothetical protein
MTLPVLETSSAPSPAPPSPRRSLRGLQVLVVEDDTDALEVLGALLRD